jgi:hypothetical protein
MSGRGTFEQPDAQFLAHANTVGNECTTHAEEWHLEAERLTTLNLRLTNANTAYAANNDVATKNHTTSVNKKAAFSELKNFLSLFVDYLVGNLSVPDEALATMGLRSREHSAHLPSPPPGEAPLIHAITQHGEITVYASRANFGQPTKGVGKTSFRGFKLRWRFEGETVWHTEVTTRQHFSLHFDQADETKRVELSAAWVNSRLEEGPWSENITEVVS